MVLTDKYGNCKPLSSFTEEGTDMLVNPDISQTCKGVVSDKNRVDELQFESSRSSYGEL